jgi:hydroxymethylpyrimidine/phosphomethylpyrimidine kinase
MTTATALTIAGSDSGGGAGIQADIKTFSALGVYATSVITALTAQNTRAVSAVLAVPPEIVAAQIKAVLEDIDIHAVKIGMLANAEIIRAVGEALTNFKGPIVLDPVMVAKSGDALLGESAVLALLQHLVPRADVLTPNLPEAAKLLGRPMASSIEETLSQGRALCALGAAAVLMKGGHAKGDICTDILVTSENSWHLEAPRINTRNTHGTGCTLSSAIAAELAKGATMFDAASRAHRWLHGAIAAADQLNIGKGHGPVHHFHEVWE